MIFLVEYERSEGKIVTFRDYNDSQRLEAQNALLELELDLNRRDINHEVVLLEAQSEADLRRTHRRYFENLQQIYETGCSQPQTKFGFAIK